MLHTTNDDLETLDLKLRELIPQLKEAVDVSIRVASANPKLRADVASRWEGFFGAFYKHLRARGRETGQNLLSWVSFSRISS